MSAAGLIERADTAICNVLEVADDERSGVAEVVGSVAAREVAEVEIGGEMRAAAMVKNGRPAVADVGDIAGIEVSAAEVVGGSAAGGLPEIKIDRVVDAAGVIEHAVAQGDDF